MKRLATGSLFVLVGIVLITVGLSTCEGDSDNLPLQPDFTPRSQSGTTDMNGEVSFAASSGATVTFELYDSDTSEALPNVPVTYMEGSVLSVIQDAAGKYAPAVFYDTAVVSAVSIGLTVKGAAESAKDYYGAIVYVDNKMDEAFMNPNASGVICMTAREVGELIYNEQAGTSIARSALLLLSSSLISSDPLSLFGVIGSELAETTVLDFIDHLLAYQLNGIMAPDDLIAVRFRSHDPVQFTLAGLYLQDVYELTAATPELCGDIGNIPPSVKPGRGEPTGPDSALLTGTVHPNGLETTVYFRWGPTPALGKQTAPQVISGGSALPVTAPITGLAPWTLYYFRLIATNSKGLTARDGWFFMNGPDNGYPSIATDSLSTGKVGHAYGPVTLQANGGNPPITWRALANTLPPGLRLDTSGKITGTPTTAGEYGLLVQAEDSWFFHRLVTKTIPIIIESQITANQNPVITQLTASPASVMTGETAEFVCNASDADGDTLTYSWTRTAGTISGTGSVVIWTAPAIPGTFRITCNVSDGMGGLTANSIDVLVTGASPSPLLSVPTLNSPANGATGISTTPTFSWSAVTGANRYWLMVATSSEAFPTDPNATSCPRCIITGTTGSTSHALPDAFPYGSGSTGIFNAGTTYSWKVQAWNTNGTQGQYPNAFSFTTSAPPLPDLTTSATVASSYISGQSGVQIPVTVSRTGGSLTSGSYVEARLFWSTNNTWDGADTLLWNSNGSTPDYPNSYLNSNGSKTVTATLNVPSVSSGTYYVLAVVDPTNFHAESNENNNVAAYSVNVSVPSTNYSISPTSTQVNESAGAVSFTVSRSGSLPVETLYVSTTQTEGYTNSSDYIGKANEQLTFTSLQTSKTATVTIINDSVAESNETFGLIVQRNSSDPVTTYLVKATFTIVNDDSVSLPDLTTSATVASSYTSGQSGVQIPVTVSRTGGSLTSGSYVEAKLYWSTNSAWDGTDTQLWVSNGSTPDYPNTYLNTNGSKTVTATLNVPSVSSGIYYILAVVDPTNFHTESNESNNVAAYAVNVTSSSPSERLSNGSFISGTSGWLLSGDFWAGTNLSSYRTSPGYAAGGVDNTGTAKNNANGSMYQSVTIPAPATTATLSFWYNITSNETSTTTAYDFLNVTIQNSSGGYLATVLTRSNLNKHAGAGAAYYQQATFDLLPYKGQTIRIYFLATSDGSNTTTFRVDDVSVMANGS